MPDTWSSYGVDPVNLEPLESLSAGLSALDTLITARVKVAQGALAATSIATQRGREAGATTLNAAANAVRATTDDLRSNGVHSAVHVNVNWNPDWQYRKPANAPQAVTDYVTDRALPWSGTGVLGWLQDLAASALNESDPFRPFTDEDSTVGGFIFLQGVTDAADMKDLGKIFKAFQDTNGILDILDLDRFSEATETDEALMRLGQVATSKFIQKGAGRLRMKPELRSVFGDVRPLKGNYPKWVGVSPARVLPGVGIFLDTLNELTDMVDVEASSSDHISQILDLLAARVSLIEDASERMQASLSTLVDLNTFFASVNVIYLDPQPGGFSSFIARAATASGVPDFGERGIVAGAVVVGTHDVSLNHLEALFNLVGLRASAVSDGTTTYDQGLDDNYSSLF